MPPSAPPRNKKKPGRASAANTPRATRLQSFILQYHPVTGSVSKELDIFKIKYALRVPIARIKTVDSRTQGYLALISTEKRLRLHEIKKKLTAPLYNAIDKGGLQIAGTDGLHIYGNDRTDPDATTNYARYAEWVQMIYDEGHRALGYPISRWTQATWTAKKRAEEEAAEDAEFAAMYGDDGGDEEEEEEAAVDAAAEPLPPPMETEADLKCRLERAEAQLERAQARIAELEAQLAEAARAP